MANGVYDTLAQATKDTLGEFSGPYPRTYVTAELHINDKWRFVDSVYVGAWKYRRFYYDVYWTGIELKYSLYRILTDSSILLRDHRWRIR